VHASAAAGWYPPEAQGAVRWAWSSGPGVLRLYAATPQTVRLRFALRGLQPQRITATWQGRILWTAVIGTQLQRGEIADLTVPAGGADLIFTSDHPGLPESADARSRTLAFALYQLRID